MSRRSAEADLQLMRREIDRINSDLLALLVERFTCVLNLAEIKTQLRLSAHDPKRVREMLDHLQTEWRRHSIAENAPWALVEPVFSALFESSAQAQCVSSTPSTFVTKSSQRSSAHEPRQQV